MQTFLANECVQAVPSSCSLGLFSNWLDIADEHCSFLQALTDR